MPDKKTILMITPSFHLFSVWRHQLSRHHWRCLHYPDVQQINGVADFDAVVIQGANGQTESCLGFIKRIRGNGFGGPIVSADLEHADDFLPVGCEPAYGGNITEKLVELLNPD